MSKRFPMRPHPRRDVDSEDEAQLGAVGGAPRPPSRDPIRRQPSRQPYPSGPSRQSPPLQPSSPPLNWDHSQSLLSSTRIQDSIYDQPTRFENSIYNQTTVRQPTRPTLPSSNSFRNSNQIARKACAWAA